MQSGFWCPFCEFSGWNALAHSFRTLASNSFWRQYLCRSCKDLSIYRCQDQYCRRKELMACVRKPREKLCASAFHTSKTRKTRTQSERLMTHFVILSTERVNGRRAKTSRKTMRERVPSLQSSKNPHAKWAAKPPTFGALFSSFGGVELARA